MGLSPDERYQQARQELQAAEDALKPLRNRLDEAHSELRNAMNTGGADPLPQVEKYIQAREAYDEGRRQIDIAREVSDEAFRQTLPTS